MHFDLNVPLPDFFHPGALSTSKKGKGKQQASCSFTAVQMSSVEARLDLLVRLGYAVIAFNQFIQKKLDPKTHVNTADGLVNQLQKRPGILYLKRLSIILDEDSEKGFGLTTANSGLYSSYDLISLVPLTQATFSLACLTHSMPSPLTAHIISLPLTLPRLSFHLKHTLIRTAIKNGAVFEINYVGSLGGDNDSTLVCAGGAENGSAAKKNWWAAAKELIRVTKGKNIIVSGGVVYDADIRAPADVGNLITLLGLAQDVAHSSLTKVPKSLVLRAQTRKSYRAVLSEPKVVIPSIPQPEAGPPLLDQSDLPMSEFRGLDLDTSSNSPQAIAKKRLREGEEPEVQQASLKRGEPTSRGKKRKKNNEKIYVED